MDDLADGPPAVADTVHQEKWELEPVDDIPVAPPWEGIYYTDSGDDAGLEAQDG